MVATFLHRAHVHDPCLRTLSYEPSSPWIKNFKVSGKGQIRFSNFSILIRPHSYGFQTVAYAMEDNAMVKIQTPLKSFQLPVRWHMGLFVL